MLVKEKGHAFSMVIQKYILMPIMIGWGEKNMIHLLPGELNNHQASSTWTSSPVAWRLLLHSALVPGFPKSVVNLPQLFPTEWCCVPKARHGGRMLKMFFTHKYTLTVLCWLASSLTGGIFKWASVAHILVTFNGNYAPKSPRFFWHAHPFQSSIDFWRTEGIFLAYTVGRSTTSPKLVPGLSVIFVRFGSTMTSMLLFL